MKLALIRTGIYPDKTFGKLSVNSIPECDTLEDIDRGLYNSQTESEIRAVKVHGQTAIPYGTYKVILSWSPRFKMYLPLILNVPGFIGIRIHSGNDVQDTDGCLLVGERYGNQGVIKSKSALSGLLAKIKAVERKEEIVILVK